LEEQEVGVEEYKNLAKRVDSIESSVEFVLTKV
jgi:tetrahydromethanopterin S-methyltransferase subunit G